MTRLLMRAAVFLGSAAIGLLAASLLVSGMSIDAMSFVVVVVVFAVLQSVLAPPITRMASGHDSALVGAAGLLSTVVALVISALLLDGLSITGGPGPWILASVIVWLTTMLAALLLPAVIGRLTTEERSDPRQAGTHP